MNSSQVIASKQFEAVVFDMDGLIFNTEALYPKVGHEILSRRNRTLTQELTDQMMGKRHDEAFIAMINFHDLNDTVEQLTAESDEIFKDILDTDLKTMPGFFELLDAIDRIGLPKAVATSARRHSALDLLDRYDLVARFDSILCGDEVSAGKPSPEIYLETLKRLGVQPDKTIIFEDSQTGCKAAVASQAYAVAVPGEHSKGHDFPGAAFVADTLADQRIYQVLGLKLG